MFADKLNSLMNIAEVSNSLLGRAVSMNPSYIGRLRSGARPLPKRHEYLGAMCRYMAGRIRTDYQRSTLQRLTGIAESTPESLAALLEKWLLTTEPDTPTERLISDFSSLPSASLPDTGTTGNAAYLYGNEGKRRAVEQFFATLLQEDKPRTLLLFSDENMAWLYEDSAFAARWAELFKRVIAKGNRVKIIHTVARDMNEMLEAVTKWLPIYMSGMVEPFYYPRLRDGILRRTLFIAPDTAAVVSSSVLLDTEGMLNMFLTDQAAVKALESEFERYLSLCRPLMQIYTPGEAEQYRKASLQLAEAEGDAFLCCKEPPLFTMSEKALRDAGSDVSPEKWEKSVSVFQKTIKNHRLTLILPEQAAEGLRELEKQYKNLTVCFVRELAEATVYAKEDAGVIVAMEKAPGVYFVISEKNMISAFWDYLGKCVLP